MKKVPLQILRIDDSGYHLMITMNINGLKANALIDTGASRTILDKNRADHYLDHPTMNKYEKFFSGLGTGPIETFQAVIGSIGIEGLVLRDQEVVVIDLRAINQSYALFDLPKIDLVLGCDLLLKMNAVIDCPKRTLIVNISE
jgi:predicted aspartyl protease